jgi:hypothetical protein
MFMVEACYPEWSTEAAPIILADPWTYGRPSRFLPQAESLEGNRQKLLNGMEIPKQAGIPFIYAGGIDPVVYGADPEFCGKNAVMICEVTDGYWIFYEGPKYKEDHPEYFKWFTWANQSIAGGNFQGWHEPRKTPEDWALELFKSTGERPRLVAPEADRRAGQKVDYPTVHLRGENLLFVAGRAGQPVEVVLQNQPVARYQSLLAWELRSPAMQKVDSGTIPHGEAGTIAFTPEADGVYLLGASAGSCAYSVASSTAPVGLYAGEGLSLIYGVDRLYFKVPAGTEQFTLSVRSAGAETVRVDVYDPDGNQAATGQTTLQSSQTEIPVPVGGQAGKVWSLALGKADAGVLEDSTITLDPKLIPTLSLSPEQVFDLSLKE